jgi:hypothetical protein
VIRKLLLLAALAAVAVAPTASAHTGGPPGFTSTITRVTPQTSGLRATVLQGDDRIGLRNTSGKTIVVLGYQREPYLRFTPHAVYRNDRSPATYLNTVRLGDVPLPAIAEPKAKPDWKQVSDGPYYEWHDHRIHWMSPILPPQVRRDKNARHHIFDWVVPIRVGAEQGTLEGTLDYSPPPTSRFNALLLVPLAALALAGAAVWWRRREKAP